MKWISVEDRLPSDDEQGIVIVTLRAKVKNAHSGHVVVDTDTFYTSEGFWWGNSENYKVTHWMPMPPPAE